MALLQAEGQLYKAGGSASLAVLVSFEADSISVTCQQSQQPLVQASLDELKISDKLGNTPRDILFANKDLLTLICTPAIDDWLHQGNTKSTVSGFEKSKRMVALSVVLVPLMLLGIYKYLIPAAAIGFADYVPAYMTQVASEHTLFAMDKTLLSPTLLSEQTQQDYLDEWAETIDQLALETDHYQILFRQSDIMQANAFALPDGTIVITDDMVALVDDNPDLLLAILLHEIGHVEHKHSMRLVAQSLASSVVVSYLFGDLSGMAEIFTGTTTTIMQNRFSQALEWQADNYALSQLDRLGLSRETFAQAMEKLQDMVGEESQLSVLMSSHPLMEQRIQNARSQE